MFLHSIVKTLYEKTLHTASNKNNLYGNIFVLIKYDNNILRNMCLVLNCISAYIWKHCIRKSKEKLSCTGLGNTQKFEFCPEN